MIEARMANNKKYKTQRNEEEQNRTMDRLFTLELGIVHFKTVTKNVP